MSTYWPTSKSNSIRTAWIPHQPGQQRPQPGDTLHIPEPDGPGRTTRIKRVLTTRDRSTLVSHHLPDTPNQTLFDPPPTDQQSITIAETLKTLHRVAAELAAAAQTLKIIGQQLATHQPADPPPTPSRIEIAATTLGYCYICLQPTTSDQATHIDHITPRSQGGTNDPDNLALVHAECNLRKHDRPWDELPTGLTPLSRTT